MSERRHAVLIASSQFPNEPKLQALRCPENDVDGLNDVLSSPDHGAFAETFVLKNVPHHEAMLKIIQVLKRADRNDLVLIYYSGHGKVDSTGRLHLATVNTTVEALEATSIPMESILHYIEVASCNKVVLLDCCFSGAAGRAFMRGSVDDQLQRVSGGRGTYLMTASTGLEAAIEKETDQYGVFTKHIIEGVRGGEADIDGDGQITMDELYNYVHARVRDEGAQDPMRWNLSARGELVIARTTKSPREERRRQIRELIYDLASKRVLPDRVVRKALEVITLRPDELAGELREYDALLDRLLKKRLDVIDFIDEWYQVKKGPTIRTDKKPEAPSRASPAGAAGAKQPFQWRTVLAGGIAGIVALVVDSVLYPGPLSAGGLLRNFLLTAVITGAWVLGGRQPAPLAAAVLGAFTGSVLGFLSGGGVISGLIWGTDGLLGGLALDRDWRLGRVPSFAIGLGLAAVVEIGILASVGRGAENALFPLIGNACWIGGLMFFPPPSARCYARANS